ncbi:MAG: DUF2189 domain-containing protein, partial [Roseibium sp.]|nr:DUF2189 domain-containing protein [Roseibium sp.]
MSENNASGTEAGSPAKPALRPMPQVNQISVNDVIDALAAGLSDFRRAPIFGLSIGALFAFGGLFVVMSAWALNMSYLSYPAAAGFVLIGPFAAVGLYEVSRRLESGDDLSWNTILGTIW